MGGGEEDGVGTGSLFSSSSSFLESSGVKGVFSGGSFLGVGEGEGVFGDGERT